MLLGYAVFTYFHSSMHRLRTAILLLCDDKKEKTKMKEFLQDNLKVFVVPVELMDFPDLDIYEQMIYMVLRSYCSPRNNSAFPKYATLARLGRMSERKAIDAVKGLIEKHLIKKEIRLKVTSNRKVTNDSNLYTLIHPNEALSHLGSQDVEDAQNAPEGVHDMHPVSAQRAPRWVHDMHSPGAQRAYEQVNLTNQDITKPLNNSQSVKESKAIKKTTAKNKKLTDQPTDMKSVYSNIESEAIKTAIAKNKKMTDRLTDIESVYLIIQNHPGYSDALFISTLQKAIKAQIKVPFEQYLLRAMINNMNEQQNKRTTEKSKSKNDLPDYVKNQLAQTNKEVAGTRELDKEKKKEGLDLLFQLREIDEREYQKRLSEL